MKSVAMLYGDKDDIDALVNAMPHGAAKVLSIAVPMPKADQMTLDKELQVAARLCVMALTRGIDGEGERQLLPTGR